MFLIPNCVGIVWKITANQFFLKACKQTQHTSYVYPNYASPSRHQALRLILAIFQVPKHTLLLDLCNVFMSSFWIWTIYLYGWLHNVSIYSTIPSPSLCRQGLQNSINNPLYTFASNFPRFSHWSTPWWDDEMRVGDMQFYILINETFILSHVHFVTKRTYSNVH